jgi:hypothetical protein
MAMFPALSPSSRRYDLGIFPVTVEPSFAGGSVRFLHGRRSSGHTLELQYENLTQTESALIRDHYRGQQNGLLAFLLSAEVWAGNPFLPWIGVTAVVWKYAAPPEENQKSGGYVDMTVSLVSTI